MSLVNVGPRLECLCIPVCSALCVLSQASGAGKVTSSQQRSLGRAYRQLTLLTFTVLERVAASEGVLFFRDSFLLAGKGLNLPGNLASTHISVF